ncbi:hypothetical protein BS78_09G037200 [Paspalum vaginatum]|nr:hypothetical protein BS78_09G037200 [Paspalum vaginatum]
MTGPGDELAELLWDHGPALSRPPPFQPFSCSAAGSSRAHELKRHAAADAALPLGMLQHDAAPPLGLAGLPDADDDAVPPWLHCPVVDDADDTAPLPPEYCASLLPAEYSAAAAASAVPPEAPAAAAKQAAPAPAPSAAAEGVMNFTFFSRPLQRPPASHPEESTAVQAAAAAATNRLRSTPLFSEQRMAWLQPPKAPRAGAAAAVAPPPPPPPTQAPPLAPPDGRCRGVAIEAATVTPPTPPPPGMQLQPEARAAPDAVTTSSVCSGNGDRSQANNKRSGSRSLHHQPTDCSVSLSQDELDVDDEGGATRRSAAAAAAARSSKRSRTAEGHNLSERRRRDRINEKMRALQELIPNCNKIDKASMLEEAIEYLKTLQLQVQMMSMGTGLCVPPPMLLPHHPMAQYAHAHFPHPHPHHLGMGMGMGMGLGFGGFDMLHQLPRVPAHFPCPTMAMPPGPGPMFGVPSPAAVFAHAAGAAAAAAACAPAPAPARPGAEQGGPKPT